MSELDLARVALALAVLLMAAHAGRLAFTSLHQPPVIGEILGGVLLGPTVLARLLPDVQAALLPTDGPVALAVGLVAHLGLLLLMFVAGAEVRGLFHAGDRRLVLVLVGVGTGVTAVVAMLFLLVIDIGRYAGPAARGTPALVLVVVCAFTVMSVPVISRIMLDLGLLRTRFARIVLSVALLEDLITYAVLAVALVLAGSGDSGPSLPVVGGMSAPWPIVYHASVVAAFVVLMLGVGPRVLRRRTAEGAALGVAAQLVLMLTLVGVASLVGVPAMFGAFVAGCLISSVGGTAAESTHTIGGFGMAFFIPVYFAFIGFRLDLLHNLDVAFTAGFIAAACAGKTAGVYLAGRISGEPSRPSLNLAAAANARGGPGLVLATTALAAGIIDDRLFTTLVLLAVVTSFMAASWLRWSMTSTTAAVRARPVRSSV